MENINKPFVLLEESDLRKIVEEVISRISTKGEAIKDKWVTGDFVMQALGISRSTLQTLRDEGTIRYSQLSKKIILYDIDSLEQYINCHIKNPFNELSKYKKHGK